MPIPLAVVEVNLLQTLALQVGVLRNSLVVKVIQFVRIQFLQENKLCRHHCGHVVFVMVVMVIMSLWFEWLSLYIHTQRTNRYVHPKTGMSTPTLTCSNAHSNLPLSLRSE